MVKTLRTARKVLIYPTHDKRLLAFRHPFHPEAGIQVPAGTIEDGEDPAGAAARELREETGLDGCRILGLLGERDYSWQAAEGLGRERRYFFHAAIEGPVSETWRHYERHASDGSGPIAFDFFWCDLRGAPPLLAWGHGDLLPVLMARL
ncbi:MAG: NUDIX domain-containing protein [Proteobacteria bacterium]|nr:NUDIX domain-containing protein [Pseudomonadota bacterium]MBI3496782.1 NUDIX domain-containing protein [Pseudomonadota bacterium]